MPGIETDLAALGLDTLPPRLAALLVTATERLERRAADPKETGEAIARGLGVLARTGSAFVLCLERLARLRARGAANAGDTDETEEADMDDAEEAGARRPDAESRAADAARLERDLRQLARNLYIPGADDRGGDGDGAAGTRGDPRELVGAGARPSAAAA